MNEMLRKQFKKLFLPIVFSVFFVSAVLAAVEPNAVVVFFLPVQNTADIDSPHASKYEPSKTGVVISTTTDNLPEPSALQEKHGIMTPAGVSLYAKGKTPLEEAENNVLAPAKVMILPPEGKKRDAASVPGTPDSVVPLPIRIFPLTHPKKEMEDEAGKRPIATVETTRYRTPPPRGRRPADEREWTAWILEQLKDCEGNLYEALPTLYWMMANGRLTGGRTDCDMKNAVAGYLRKCHPWPVVYYTPVNADVPRQPLTQMAAEVIETAFDSKSCPSLNLTGVNFEKVEFDKGRLKGMDFSRSYFYGALFLDSDLTDAVFQNAVLDNVLIRGGTLTRAYFKEAAIRNSHLQHVNVSMVNFEGADMVNTQLRDVDVTVSNFRDAKLANTAWEDVRGYRVNAKNAGFVKAGFDNVLFEDLNAEGADFSQIFCKNCIFEGAFLKEADFYKAMLDGVSFKNANLSGAVFQDARFENKASLLNAELYRTDFSGVDLSLFPNIPAEVWRLTKIDSRTVMPKDMPDFEAAEYDIELFKNAPPENAWSCTPKMCADRLLGRVSNTNIAVRAMSLLSSQKSSADDKVWALCTMGCLARHDKKLEPSQVDILTAFIREQRPWSTEDLFKTYEPISPEVQMALYILIDPENNRDPGYDVSLAKTDLRGADLSRGDLRNISFAGANLGGANLRESLVDKSFSHFDQIVIDRYTVLPKSMKAFMPFELPDSPWPSWWKPGKVRVFKDNINLWSVTTEQIPFSDGFIVGPIKENTEKKEK